MRRPIAMALMLGTGCAPSADLGGGQADPTAQGSGGSSGSVQSSSGVGDDGTPADDSDGDGDGGGDGGSTGAVPDNPMVVPRFTEVAEAAGLSYVQGELHFPPECLTLSNMCTPEWMTGGAAVGDYDGDGWDDLFMARTTTSDVLLRNLGDGTFEDVTAAAGLTTVFHAAGAAFGDIDNDGDLDLYVAAIADIRHYLFINDGNGRFTEDGLGRDAAVPSANIHTGMTPTFGDYDLDGYLDVYVSEWRTVAALGDVPSHARLLRNRGADAPGYFVDVTDAANVNIDGVSESVGAQFPGVFAFAPAFTDLDGDDFPELAIVGDFQTSRLFWNDGNGAFTDGTDAAHVGTDDNGMGSAFGDLDADGDLDWYVTSITEPADPPANRLYRNDGSRQFSDVAVPAGVGSGGWGWGTVFIDANNDGHLDLVSANGYYYSNHNMEQNLLWVGDGTGQFEDVSVEAGLGEPRQSRGLLTWDYDRDGDLDLLFTNNADTPELYRNDTETEADYLRVRTRGVASNAEGCGARVTLVGDTTPLREIGPQSYFMAQSERVAHFGLGHGSAPVPQVEVYWPASGQTQVLRGVERNQVLEVTEP